MKRNVAGPREIDAIAVLALLACCIVWGINQVAIKEALQAIPPMMQAGIRSVIAALLLLGYALFRGVRIFDRDGTAWPGIIAGVLFAIEFVFLYVGLAYTTASRGVVFLYCAPFVVAIGSHYLVAGDRLSLAKTLGLGAAFAGVVLAMGESLWQPSKVSTVFGDTLSFLAAVLWGFTTLIVRVTPLKSAPAEKTLLYQLALSGLLLPIASVAWGEPAIGALTPRVLAAFVYSAFVVAFISYLTWFWLVRTYPPSKVSAFTFLAPVFGVLAGVLMLGEPLTATLVAALALVALGIYLVNRPQRA